MSPYPNREMWLADVAPVAVAMYQEYGFPPHVLVAHWAVECGGKNRRTGQTYWGANVIGENNHCGMKWRERHGARKVSVPTKEWLTPRQATRLQAQGKVLTPTGKFKNPRWEYSVVDEFADYGSIEACALDYVGLLRRGVYADAWTNFRNTGDWKRFVRQYMVYYATANKAELVIQIATQANVRAAIEAASLLVARPVT